VSVVVIGILIGVIAHLIGSWIKDGGGLKALVSGVPAVEKPITDRAPSNSLEPSKKKP
jgi:hypothetical protein